MHPFNTLSQEALLIALTEYYEKYRRIIELGGQEDDYIVCKFSLENILYELNTRRGTQAPFVQERKDFEFTRIKPEDD